MTNPEPATQPDSYEDVGHDAAGAAQVRADGARRRAGAARQAAERATTEYARRAHHRVADLHAEIARHHELGARTPRHGDDG
jgi:hypothetical protein